MRISAVIITVLLIFGLQVHAQDNFSPRTKLLYQSTTQGLSNKNIRLPENINVFNMDNIIYVNAMAKISDGFDESFFSTNGITKRSSAGNIISLTIPVDKLSLLSARTDIEYLSVDSRLKPLLDSAVSETGAFAVHSGIGLPYNITGKNVVVGIIDLGFDYSHPVFYHSADSLRITRVWGQQEERRSPPEGFQYGEELKSKEEILNKKRSIQAEYESHGTHVAGIAAGSGYLSNGKYTGAAPGAEIVLVETGYGESNLIDAVSYIFKYAASVGKPAVINMSLGSHSGPHDGTSLLDQAFDALQGEGKILVGAAGNEGGDQIHFIKKPEQDSARTVWQMFQSGYQPGKNVGEMEIWGSANEPFSARFTVIDTLTKQVIAVSGAVSTENEYTQVVLINNSDTLSVIDVSPHSGESAGVKPAMFVSALVNKNYYLAVTIAGSSTVHSWDLTEGGFTDLGLPLLFNAGDNDYTMGEVGGTGKNIITAGAYTTKNNYTNLNGEEMPIPYFTELGKIASFSSHGPTVDGRTKPDISAPGNAVASSISSFDGSFEEELFSQYLVDKTTVGNKEWKYAIMQGTSMSAPMVTGIIALMLEANPTLSSSDIKDIFRETARKDIFTGEIPGNGSNTWGAGKIDAYHSVLAALNPADVEDNENHPGTFILYNNYPNPFNPVTSMQYSISSKQLITLKVYDILGVEIAVLVNGEKAPGVYTVKFDASGLTSGVYFYRLQAGNFVETRKMLLMR